MPGDSKGKKEEEEFLTLLLAQIDEMIALARASTPDVLSPLEQAREMTIQALQALRPH